MLSPLLVLLVPYEYSYCSDYGSRDFAGRFGLDFSMAVVAVPFILYLVRFCSSKSCNKYEYSTTKSPESPFVLCTVCTILVVLVQQSTVL